MQMADRTSQDTTAPPVRLHTNESSIILVRQFLEFCVELYQIWLFPLLFLSCFNENKKHFQPWLYNDNCRILYLQKQQKCFGESLKRIKAEFRNDCNAFFPSRELFKIPFIIWTILIFLLKCTHTWIYFLALHVKGSRIVSGFTVRIYCIK